MKRQKLVKMGLGLIVAMGLCSTLGCVSQVRERDVEYDVTKSGKNWVQHESVHTHRGPGQCDKSIVEKQFVYEQMKCVNKKGLKINASTPEECIKLGGKVIVESIVNEETVTKR